MKKIVYVDNDTSYIVPLKTEFERAGFEVNCWDDAQKALDAISNQQVDLVICEVELPQMDGHKFFKKIRSIDAFKSTPFIFLSSQKRVDDRIKSMELGVDDYIIKPFSIEEIVARIKALLKEITLLNDTNHQPEKGFSGNLTEMNLVDLIQTLELGKKSALLNLKHDSASGLVYIKNGEVIDASLESLPPEQALMRMFTWTIGNFYVEMTPIDRERNINIANKELITIGLRRINQWDQIKDGLPPLNTVVIKTDLNNSANLSEDEKQLITAMNEKNMIYELVQKCPCDDLQALELIKGLLNKGYLKATDENFTSYTDNYLAHLKEVASRSRTTSERAVSIMSSYFKPSSDEESPADISKDENRILPDRRRYERRLHDRLRDNNHIHLTKAELLLIRERLS